MHRNGVGRLRILQRQSAAKAPKRQVAVVAIAKTAHIFVSGSETVSSVNAQLVINPFQLIVKNISPGPG